MFSIEMMLMGRSESWHKPHHEELHLERAVMFFSWKWAKQKAILQKCTVCMKIKSKKYRNKQSSRIFSTCVDVPPSLNTTWTQVQLSFLNLPNSFQKKINNDKKSNLHHGYIYTIIYVTKPHYLDPPAFSPAPCRDPPRSPKSGGQCAPCVQSSPKGCLYNMETGL